MLTVTTLTSLAQVVDTVNMRTTKSALPTDRRPYHHGNLRESLVDAGMQLARSGGPGAVVLRAVSREAGVSHNAGYRHFADHEDLLAAVSDRCMAELADLMRQRKAEVTVRGATKRAWAKLEAIGRAYIDFAVTEPGWFRTAFSVAHGAPPPSPGQAVDERALGPFELLSARLDELVEVGAIPPERRPGAEHAAWSMVHGLSSLLVDGPLRALPKAEVDQIVGTVLGVVTRGL
jgi:AcrR family transcriptional regulator